ncbi:MAG: ABC transporter permease, partial [Gemmatimonadota bacterium]
EVVGKTIAINGSSSTVIGVMPPEFEFPSEDVELWAPIGLLADRMQNRAVHTLTTVARLEDGVSLDEAKVEMATIAARIQREFPGEDPEHTTMLIPLHERVVGNTDTILLVLMGAVAFLLLIACANVADLLMARAAARQKEIAVRTALGASRWRVIRQLVTESVLLGLTGGAAALALAFWGLDLLVAHLPPFMPRVEQIGIDGRVLLFTLLISLLTGLIFGLLPALKASKPDIVGSLKDLVTSAAGGARDRSRRVLVIAQVALSLVLLVGAGLMIKSFWRLQDVDPGFEPQNLLTMTVSLAGSPKFTTSEEVIAFYADLRGRLEALPGVSSASAVNALPISGGDSDGELTIEGRPFASGAAPGASFRRILPNYFRTAGIPIVQGREFGERDRGEEPFVVIITETMARKYWPDGDAVGTRIKVGPPENEPWLTIVGVAADVRNIGLATQPGLATYEPHTQRPWSTMNVMVRTAIDPLSVVRGVRDEIRQAGGDLPVFNIGTMRERISRSVSTERFNMILLTIFATVALLLAAIGLYGVIAYSVSHRTRELGIRIALGAERKDIVNLVVRQGIPLLGAGVALGLIAAAGLTRFLAGLLFAVSPLDATIFVAVAALLAAVALLASYVPARRATAVDPMQALRAE